MTLAAHFRSRRGWLGAAVSLVCSPRFALAQLPAAAGFQVYDDYADPTWPSSHWTKFRTSQYDLWDPATVVRLRGGADASLTIDLPRFTQSHPNHVKALLLSARAFELGPDSTFTVKVAMRVQTHATERNPFGLPPGDVRLASGAVVVIDPDTGMVFDFLVSSDTIRPLYERLPVARQQLGDYPAYSKLGAALPTQPGRWHTYEIRYSAALNVVQWWVDGTRLAEQENVGAAPGEGAPVVKLRRPRIGAGMFTLLDDLNDDRLRAGDHARQRGFIPSNWEDRFGQGVTAEFGPFRTAVA